MARKSQKTSKKNRGRRKESALRWSSMPKSQIPAKSDVGGRFGEKDQKGIVEALDDL